jgi:2-polyprenyl-3-methyl-5-hydroxy-6-metoxy-1,4-benzoquinol methylase
VADLDKKISLPFPKKYFDYVVALDVIEHLTQPEYVLSAIKAHLKPDGKIIVSTPNIAHAMVRWMLVRGEFEYSDTGILDKTHVHFYHRRSLAGLLRKEGYRVEKIIPTNGMCKVPFLYKITDRLPLAWQYGLVKLVPDLFAFQFIAVARVAKR